MKKQDNSSTIDLCRQIALKVKEAGGTVYYVGGFVRDKLLGIESKDIDIEIHGIDLNKIQEILSQFGEIDLVGASFGIFMIKGKDLDISVPRIEKSMGKGHKDFQVSVDPFLGTEKAAKRRDFTVNALMEDVLTGQIVDHYGGREDLEKKILRCVDEESFAEDPLRVLRGARFAAKLNFLIDEKTIDLCRTINLSELSKERVYGELTAALTKTSKPSMFFKYLREMDQLGYWFKEIENLIGVVQPPEHHSEGDVWNHTMLVIDEAAKLKRGWRSRFTDRILEVENFQYFMMSALCHDFGKVSTTEEINGKIHALGHEDAGVDIAAKFINRLTLERDLKKYVKNMILLHMKPNMYGASNSKIKSTNRLFFDSVDPAGLVLIARADFFGRGGAGDYSKTEEYLVQRLNRYEEMMKRPYVSGQDLIASGLVPGENFAAILKYAEKLRIAEINKESALKQILAYSRKLDCSTKK
ncbi:MAG: HD domain-containing protein [Eubacterium sp.]|nr:HD domain-containing protein [Eubacterium sp.]